MSSLAAQTPPQNPPAQAPPDAQRGRPNAPPQRGGPNPAQTMIRVNEMLDSMEIIRAKDFLQLTAQQYPTFFERIQELFRSRTTHQMQRNRALMELQRLTGPQAPSDVEDALIEAKIKALEDVETQSMAAERKAMAAIDEILSVRQRARFRVLENQIEKDKLRMLAEVIK